MEPSTLLGLHLIIVTAFLFFFLFKTILLLAGKDELLNSVREKTKIIDMIWYINYSNRCLFNDFN